MRSLQIVLFSFLFLNVLSSAPLNVELSAKSAILMNAESGAILFEKEAHTPSYPASITKIATALYALEKKGHALDESAKACHDAVSTISSALKHSSQSSHPPYRLEAGGSNIAICPGEVLSLRVLLYGLMLSSGNDAANVLAKHVSGSIDRFVQEMNEFLRKKGIKETRFLNPHGLHHPEHQTTAYDMALMAKEALKHPFFREVVKTVRYPRPETNKQPKTDFIQSNRLLKKGPYFYPKALGVKTGYTSHAGYTLVAAAEHEGRRLIAVVLGCPEMPSRYKDATRLFEAAFAEKPLTRTLFSQAFDLFNRPIKGAKKPLQAYLAKDVEMSFYPSEEPKLSSQVVWQELKLPIEEGEQVGSLKLTYADGSLALQAPLFAKQALQKPFSQEVLDFFSERRTVLILGLFGLNVVLFLIYYFKKSQKVV